MHKGWKIAAVVALCLPLLFASWLMLAARWSRMDAVTMHMPMGMRSLIAEVIVHKEGGPAKMLRARRLDPNVQEGVEGYVLQGNGHGSAVVLGDSSARANRFAGTAAVQEKSGDACGAGKSYTQAASAVSGDYTEYKYVESMGRAELRCGDLPDARAGLETAVQEEQKVLQDDDGEYEDSSTTKLDLSKDEEFLVIVYGRQKETELAKQACSVAHPEWKSCTCRLQGNDVVCYAGK